MEASLKPIAEQYAFNSTLIELALHDHDAPSFLSRPAGSGTSVGWLLGHIVTGRHHVAQLLKVASKVPWSNLFEKAIGEIQDDQFPPPEHIKREWDRITPVMMSSLAKATEQAILTAPPSPFPTVEHTTLAAIGFLAAHESYHVGQLSYVRKLNGQRGLIELFVESKH